MASKISVLIDVVTDKAISGLKGFKASLADADGAFGKMKAGSASAFGAIQQHAAGMALAAGGALVAFGAKGVAAFTDLALEAGKFRDVSGSTLDEASRWIAVGDDIGVSGDTISSAWDKMNKAIGSGKPLLKEYGIELQKTADGQADANGTFLHAIDVIKGIQDPTKKAELAAATFGKGWTSMSELIEQGSGTITEAMAEVSDAQIIDESEIAKAKAYRASMDKLKDSISDLAMEFGENLTPAVTVAADVLSEIAPIVGDMAGIVGGAFTEMADQAYEFGSDIADMWYALPFTDAPELIGPTLYEWSKLERGTADLVAEFSNGTPTMDEFVARLKAAGKSTEETSLATIEYGKQLDAAASKTTLAEGAGRMYIDMYGNLQGSIEDTTENTDDLTVANDLLARQIQITTDRYKDLKGELSAEDDFHNAEAMWADLGQSAVDSYTAAATGAEDAEQKAFDHAGAVIDAKNQVVALGEKYADLPEEEVTRIVALIDEGKLAEAEAAFNNLTRNRTMNVSIQANGGIGFGSGARASGGPVMAGGSYLVGEQGTELFTPAVNGFITPHSAIAGGWGGASGGTYGGSSAVMNLTVNAGMGADGHEIAHVIVGALGDFVRVNGPGPLRKLTGA